MKKIQSMVIISIAATISFSACSGAQKAPKTSPAISASEIAEPLTAPFPTQPFLQLDPGMHTAPITRISSDAAGAYLVTTSKDKTVRLFNTSDGSLLKTFRIPIGQADEGRLHAVSISPDGKTIACGGWTGYEWHRSNSIYIFDRESGKITKRIGRHPEVIMYLAHSPDGKYLVACLAGPNGIRVYDTSNYALIKQDKYGDTSMAADFDENGTLVTVSDDKFLRMYDKNFNLVNKTYISDMKVPAAVSINAKGDLIAVGDELSPKVNVYSRNLQYLFSPPIYGFHQSSGIFSLRFSRDGNILYAGGQASKRINNRQSNYVLYWDNKARGPMQELAVGNDSIFHLTLCGEKIAFCNADPRFGLIEGTRVFYSKSSVLSDFRVTSNRIKLSDDGKNILFGITEDQQESAIFSFDYLRMINNRGGLVPPKNTFTHSYGSYEWKNYRDYALINGLKIPLLKFENSRSFAISQDENNFVLGSDWYVRYFNRSGMVIWQKQIPGVAWDIHISGNGRFVVTALGNGIIRWLRARDGEEILNFFPHANKKDWIAWTPKGFYATSEGADSLFGWHVNQDQNKEALFFPAFVFSEHFKRPDIIKEVLARAETDVELARRKNIAFPDIAVMMPKLLEMVSKTDKEIEKKPEAEGMVVGRVYGVHGASGEVIVASSRAHQLMKMYDKVYVKANGEKIMMRVTFPMLSTAKCQILGNKAKASAIKQGDVVYK